MKKILALMGLIAVVACSSTGSNRDSNYNQSTPTVDYVERLDVRAAPHQDSFLTQLAMNYRSFAIFNARQSGHPDIGELFAQKAVAAFSGETPFPEPVDNWKIDDQNLGFELQNACQELVRMLKNDMSDYCPIEAAEAQAKFDCWLVASASGQYNTANECRARYMRAMDALRRGGPQGCGAPKPVVAPKPMPQPVPVQPAPRQEVVFYPETTAVMPAQMRARESVVVVNNVSLADHLIRPEPVPVTPPLVFNQNIYGGDKTITKTKEKNISNSGNTINKNGEVVAGWELEEETVAAEETVEQPVRETIIRETVNGDLVTREEFITMMVAMREEIAMINRRLDNMPKSEKAYLKVQQIPLEPKQHIMEEVFEVHFDFDKYQIKPEYEDVIRKLAQAAQDNRNLKVSVVGHTDTMGTSDYNFALGGRRAKTVRDMLVQYGIPSEQIVIVSAGKNDLKIPTGDQVKSPENRRVRVVKEQRYMEQPEVSHITALVEDEFEASEFVEE